MAQRVSELFDKDKYASVKNDPVKKKSYLKKTMNGGVNETNAYGRQPKYAPGQRMGRVR